MGWQTTGLVAPTLFATVVSALLGGYAALQLARGRRDPTVVIFLGIAVATTIWTGFSALKLLQTDPGTKLLFFRLLHVGAAALPPLFLLFIFGYLDRTRWLRPAPVVGLFAVPAAFIALLFVDAGGLMLGETELIRNGIVILRVEDAPGFLVFFGYSMLLVAVGVGVLLAETRRIGATYYPQTALLSVALLTPIAFSVLTMFGVPPFTDDRINLVPTAAAVSTAALGVVLVRYRLFDLPPLAYATAMRYSPDALFVLDRDGRVVHANDRGTALLERLDAHQGAILADHLPGFEPAAATDEVIEIPTDAGDVTYHRLVAEPLQRGGRAVGWVVVLRDETTQQRQQQRLQRRNDQLELFASTVSHDLRNPLTVATGHLELAQEQYDDDDLDRVAQAHERMAEIIERLLVLAREGRRIDDPEPVTVAAVADRAWANVDTPGAAVAVEDAGTVLADTEMLQHVFENLFRNTVEHGSTSPGPDSQDTVEHGSTSPASQAGQNTADDGATAPAADAGRDAVGQSAPPVRVTVGPLPDGFYVADDGPGLPDDIGTAVFDAGVSTTDEGTGLGLQIVQSVADAHGWTVTATDAETGGARFEFTGVDTAH